jgi:hypothetical protein
MARPRPFTEPEAKNLVWKADGLISAVSNRGDKIIFILGRQHRDLFLEKMRGQRTKSTGVKLSARERRALAEF